MTHIISAFGVVIRFREKPPANVLACLKRHGFRWNPGLREWQRRRVEGAADVLAALDRLLNPGRPDGDCWKCGGPEGRFRPRGAATPVWCDACNAAVLEAEAADEAKRLANVASKRSL